MDYFNAILFSLEINAFNFDMKSLLNTSVFFRNANERGLRWSSTGDSWKDDKHQQYFDVIK